MSRTRKWLIGSTLAAYLAVVIGVVTTSWLVRLDWQLVLFRPYKQWPEFHGPLEIVVVLGQRGPTAVIVLAWLGWRGWKNRDLRPLLVLGLALLLLNSTVGAVKHGLGRLGPHYATSAGSSEMFAGGDIFPSGHTANAVVTWGVLAYLATKHRRTGAVITAIFAFTVGMTTIYLGTHWVTDVLAGWTAGILVMLVLPMFEPLVATADARIRAVWARIRLIGMAGVSVPGPSPVTARHRPGLVAQRGTGTGAADGGEFTRPTVVAGPGSRSAGGPGGTATATTTTTDQRFHHPVMRSHTGRFDRPAPTTPQGPRRPRPEQRPARPSPLGGGRDHGAGQPDSRAAG